MITGLRNLRAGSAVLLDRVELYSKLLAAETKIETTLIVRRLVWAGIGAIFGLFALAMAHMAVIASFWHSDYRVWAVGAILLLDIVVAALALRMASKSSEQEPFAVTKHQLAEDIRYLKESL